MCIIGFLWIELRKLKFNNYWQTTEKMVKYRGHMI